MATVQQLLQVKGRTVHTVAPDTPIIAALRLMAEHNIGAVVVAENEQVVGIFSERDYARKVALEGRTSRDTLVRAVMTGEVVVVRPDSSIEECMAQMTARRIRHLPVLEDERLVGLISIGDVVRAVMSQQEFMIEQLEHYITQP